MMEAIFQRIMRKTGKKPVSCKCQDCKKQCHTPCLGTPDDIEKIIDAGYGDKVAITEWKVGQVLGHMNEPVFMVQAIQTKKGCIFFENGLCTLHDQGLKPTEGKLSHHTLSLTNFSFSKSISWQVAKEWRNDDNIPTILRIMEKIAVECDSL